tara:strand:+ start:206 stop:787 length:582 start_codon:yes stop_codon:yes gene_type:complete
MGQGRIGLFGGTFDPVHSAHVMVVRKALGELQLDKLLIIPAACSPFKPENPPSKNEVRLALLNAAFDSVDGCEIDLQEVERGGPSYAIDTVRSVSRRFPDSELFYLIGADHVPTLGQWREADELAKLVTFIAVPRIGESKVEFPERFNGKYLEGDPIDISSSKIRRLLKQGKPVGHLVPQAVDEKLIKLQVYQ